MRLAFLVGFLAAAVSGAAPAKPKQQRRVGLAVVGAESALGYATAIALANESVVAVHGTHSLNAMQLARIMHLRELGVETMPVDFADSSHVYAFNSTFAAK